MQCRQCQRTVAQTPSRDCPAWQQTMCGSVLLCIISERDPENSPKFPYLYGITGVDPQGAGAHGALEVLIAAQYRFQTEKKNQNFWVLFSASRWNNLTRQNANHS